MNALYQTNSKYTYVDERYKFTVYDITNRYPNLDDLQSIFNAINVLLDIK